MKRYLRLMLAFGVGVAGLALTTALILFLETWLPANGFYVSERIYMASSLGALGAAFAVGAKLCLREANKIGSAGS